MNPESTPPTPPTGKPTKGRIVLYVSLTNSEPMPAIVMRVRSETAVDLRIFLDTIQRSHESDYQTGVEYSPSGRQGTWHWPQREG